MLSHAHHILWGQFAYRLTQAAIFFPVNCFRVGEDDGCPLVDASISVAARVFLAATATPGSPIVHTGADRRGAADGR
jgi:hypothetical protein